MAPLAPRGLAAGRLAVVALALFCWLRLDWPRLDWRWRGCDCCCRRSHSRALECAGGRFAGSVWTATAGRPLSSLRRRQPRFGRSLRHRPRRTGSGRLPVGTPGRTSSWSRPCGTLLRHGSGVTAPGRVLIRPRPVLVGPGPVVVGPRPVVIGARQAVARLRPPRLRPPRLRLARLCTGRAGRHRGSRRVGGGVGVPRGALLRRCLLQRARRRSGIAMTGALCGPPRPATGLHVRGDLASLAVSRGPVRCSVPPRQHAAAPSATTVGTGRRRGITSRPGAGWCGASRPAARLRVSRRAPGVLLSWPCFADVLDPVVISIDLSLSAGRTAIARLAPAESSAPLRIPGDRERSARMLGPERVG